MRTRTHPRSRRTGAATLEFAILAPLLAFLLVIGCDFARVFYHALTVTNCARNGAVYGSADATKAADAAAIKAVALADATNLTPAPEVESVVTSDSAGQPVLRVTVRWQFKTITNFPGVPSTVDLARTVEMRVAPQTPKEG